MWLHVPDSWKEGRVAYDDAINILGGCAGSGMLEIAVEEALRIRGLRARTLVHVERDATAAAALVGIEAAAGRESAVWDDLATFDGRPWRGLIDCCCAGLPCPAFSSAGKRGGNDDPRAWGAGFDPRRRDTWGPQPHWLRILDEIRPALAVFENVPEWVAAGHFSPVGDCLSRLGYDVQEPVFLAAGDVGANHERERVFVLAHANGFRGEVWAESARQCRGAATACASDELADAEHDGRRERLAGWGSEGRVAAGGGSEALADPASDDERRDPDREHWEGIPSGRCGMHELADSGEPRRERAERGATPADAGASARRPTAECGGDVGNAQRERTRPGDQGEQGDAAGDGRCGPSDASDGLAYAVGDGRREAGDREQRPTERPSDGLPLHPPGRGISHGGLVAAIEAAPGEDAAVQAAIDWSRAAGRIWGDWETVGRLDATRMPAIESGVPVVADGLAFSNADLLRIGGNGVDTLAAATAIGTLLDRVGLGMDRSAP